MSAGLAADRPRAIAASPRLALLVTGVGALLWLLLFHAEAAAAVHVWSSSTAYGHCFLVLPVAAYLAWERRSALATVPVRACPLAAWAAVPLGAAWLAAALLGIMEGRQLTAIALLLVLVLGVVGPALWWAFVVPMLYLFFLVPFGGFLVGPLQVFTARFIDAGLDLLGVPHLVTQFVIEIPEGTFRVAEACAGLRFLIATVAFGVVYACTLYRSPGRRLAFIAAAIAIPVVANGFRALGIVMLGHALGSAEAGAVDHVLYGWMFFTIVLVLLIVAGLPFRQDATCAPPPAIAVGTSPSSSLGVWRAAAGVLLVAALAPTAVAGLTVAADREQRRLPPGLALAVLARLATPDGCTRIALGRFVCAGLPIAVDVQVFAPRSDPALLHAARLKAADRPERAAVPAEADLGSVSTWTADDPPPAGAPPLSWDITEDGPSVPLVATALWSGRTWQGSGLAMRLAQARRSVFGGGDAPILVTVVADDTAAGATELAVLHRFLARQTTLLRPGAA